jgi:hypothetical protein
MVALVAGSGLASAGEPERREKITDSAYLKLYVARDDHDDDGVPDVEATRVHGRAAKSVLWLDAKPPVTIGSVDGDAVRLIDGERPLANVAKGQRFAKLGVQGARAGTSRIHLNGKLVELQVLDVIALDAAGERVDLARSHASLSRFLPRALAPAQKEGSDPDALRWVLVGPSAALPAQLEVETRRPDGAPLDALGPLALKPHACPQGTPEGLDCRATELIRATADAVDRNHPESSGRSLRAEVGGRILLRAEGIAIASLRVGGPRKSALGMLGRYRGTLRVRLIRIAPGGSAPIGGDDASALAIARDEVRTASSLWGQCGIHFGPDDALDVALVDPPPPHFVAVGCELGLPASGGTITFRAGKQPISLRTKAGQTPTEVAAELAAAVRRAGFSAVLSPNARIGPGALRTIDVLVRRGDGALVPLAPVGEARISSDPTLDACLGEVDLADGLTHFTDFDAIAGTLEERALLKAFDDGDPTTIEVLIVPSFARTGRIGESFISNDGSSVRNAVILDRAGIRAGARSFALAHELGHILLDMPGHPDDYGVDQPTSLMDADAADPTIFGPRRLSVAECERALVQSGPKAPTPLLSEWPLFVAPKKR